MSDFTERAMKILMAESESDYGEKYRGDYLTQYRDYVGSADNISAKREKANGFFVTVNTGFIGASAYFDVNSVEAAYVQAVVGLMFCFVWGRMIHSYKTLNGSKFDVIQLMERHLPLAPFAAEEFVQKNSPKTHVSLTTVEKYVPGVFAVLHVFSAIFLISLKG
ncbi:MAG TPA: hypothetical protein VJ984_02880 [Xanthomonadales bacterium]|nr:hypothetical protein [Xanthomonadales bacterium]